MTSKPPAAKLKMAIEMSEKLAMIKQIAYENRALAAERTEKIRKEKRGNNLNSHLSKLSVSD